MIHAVSALRFALCAALMLTAPAAAAKERSFLITRFDQLNVEGDVIVIVKTGKSVSAKADGSAADLDRLDFDRLGTMLTVRLDPAVMRAAGHYNKSGPVTVTLTTASLSALTVNGAGSVTLDSLSGREGRVAINGSGHATVGKANNDRLDVVMIGNGALTIAGGNSDKLSVQIDGAGHFDGTAHRTDALTLFHGGPAETAATALRTATITNNGLGKIRVGGGATCEVRIAGGGDISC